MPNTTHKVLLLETSLDRDPRSLRSQIDFMRSFLRNYDIDFAPKQVHSREDLEHFLGWARRHPSYRLIHFVGHGSTTRRKALLHLTNGKAVDLGFYFGRRLFRGLKGRVLFFSYCSIGQQDKVMARLAKASAAKGVFSYTKQISDQESFLAEAMFYHIYLTKKPDILRMTARSLFKDIYVPTRRAIGSVFGRRAEGWLVMDPWFDDLLPE